MKTKNCLTILCSLWLQNALLSVSVFAIAGCFGETEEKPGVIKNEATQSQLQAVFNAAYDGVSVYQIKQNQIIKYTHNYRMENSEKFQANAEQLSEVTETCKIQDGKSKEWFKRISLLQTGYALDKHGQPISDKKDPNYKYFTHPQQFFVQLLDATMHLNGAQSYMTTAETDAYPRQIFQNVEADLQRLGTPATNDNESDPIDYKCDGKESKYDSKSTYDCIKFANVSLEDSNSELSAELKSNNGCQWFGSCIVPTKKMKYEVILWKAGIILDRRLYVKTISTQVPPIFIPDSGGQPSLPILNSCERFLYKSPTSSHLIDMCQTLTDIKGPKADVNLQDDANLPNCS